MNKSFLSFLLISLLPIIAFAYSFQVDGIYYEVTGNSVSVTNGTNNYSGNITIPETVFYNNETYTVSSVSKNAFFNSYVDTIVIPNSVMTIGESAFYRSERLKYIKLPDYLTSISDNMLGLCVNLKSIDIPQNVNYIGDGAFSHCGKLTSIEIPDEVTYIGSSSFMNCKGLTEFAIPNKVISIGANAFYGCNNLKDINIGNSVVKIGTGAFEECYALTNIEIPASVVDIDNRAFSDCTSLMSMIVNDDNPKYDSRNNCNAIVESSSNLLLIGCNNTIIPNSVTKIGDWAFNGMAITDIIIPESVTSIGDCAFFGCSNLYSIDIPSSVINIGEYAFRDCKRLSRIVIPNSVTSIGVWAFYNCSYMNYVEIPISLTFCGSTIFGKCNQIETFIITGSGEWKAGAIDCSTRNLYLDSRITSVEGLMINPKNEVYSFAVTPPLCDENTFVDFSASLHVPSVSLASYFTADYWDRFSNITSDAIEPQSITLNYYYIELNIGDQFDLTASLSPSNATPNEIRFYSTNGSVAIIDYDSDSVATVGVGECDIIAECLYRRAICHVVVKDAPIIITLDKHDVRIQPNEMVILTPTSSINVLPELIVTSSDPSVAAARVADDKIQVVGVKPGVATITVGSLDGTAQPDSCVVTVYSASVKGDVNDDGEVNIADINAVIDMILSDNFNVNGDVNNDGEVNIADINAIIDMILTN